MRKRMMMALENSRAAGAALDALERLDRGGDRLLRVLTYHRVADAATMPQFYPRVTVAPAAFAAQMQAVCARYSVVSMQQVLDSLHGGNPLPPRPVLITFDDATRDFAQNALPVLRALGLPAALFVATAYPDQPERVFWWDKLYAAVEHAAARGTIETDLGRLPVADRAQRYQSFSRLRDHVKALPHQQAMDFVEHLYVRLDAPTLQNDVLSWQELRQVSKQGVTLGAHTQTHPMMSQISSQAIRAETAGSLADLRRELGSVLPIFAYPSGGYTQEVLVLLKGEGIELAFTTKRGHNDLSKADLLQLDRLNVGPRTTTALLRAQLLGWMKHILR